MNLVKIFALSANRAYTIDFWEIFICSVILLKIIIIWNYCLVYLSLRPEATDNETTADPSLQ